MSNFPSIFSCAESSTEPIETVHDAGSPAFARMASVAETEFLSIGNHELKFARSTVCAGFQQGSGTVYDIQNAD